MSQTLISVNAIGFETCIYFGYLKVYESQYLGQCQLQIFRDSPNNMFPPGGGGALPLTAVCVC